MRKNSRIIGKSMVWTDREPVDGIFDVNDIYNHRLTNNWPLTQKYVSHSVNDYSVTEGDTVTLTVNTSGFEDGELLYYIINTTAGTTMTGADFEDGVVQGWFTVSNNVGTLNKVLVAGDGTENNSFQIEIRAGLPAGYIWATTSTITVGDAAGATTTVTLLRSDSANSQWSSWYSSGSYAVPHTSGTGYFVVLHSQSSRHYTADFQIDSVSIGSNYYNFDSNASGWYEREESAHTTTFDGDDWDSWNDWAGVYTNSNTVPSWGRDSNGTGSSNTGLSYASSGSWYLYTERSGGGSRAEFLRSPLQTISGTKYVTWRHAAYGSQMGERRFFWVQVSA